MSVAEYTQSLDGSDPPGADDGTASNSIATVLEEASKRIVHNILKSYMGYFDLLSEVLQNSSDAV
jgi:hypothetical protein